MVSATSTAPPSGDGASAGDRTAAPAAHRAARAVLLAAQAAVLLVGLGLSVYVLTVGLDTIDEPFPVTHPEGATIAAALRVRDGRPVYQEFRQPPYVITPYPPVQPLVTGLAARVLGLSILETIGLGRGLTLAAGLAAAGLIAAIAVSQGAGRAAALAGAGLFLPLPFLDEWGFAVRPDVPAVMLTLLAMLLLVRRPDRPWLAAGIAVLAFFTKQTAIMLPAVATAWLLWAHGHRPAVTFAATWLAGVCAGVGLAELLTGGTYLLNTVLAHLSTPKNGFDLAWRDLQPLFTGAWLSLGLAAIGAQAEIARRRLGPPVLYLIGSVGLALVTLRNTGGDVNYLIEPAAAACLVAALGLSGLWRWAARATHRPAATAPTDPEARQGLRVGARLGAALAIGALTVVWGAEQWSFWRASGGIDPIGRLPLAEIAAADTILSEEPLAVLLAGKPLLVSDTFHMSMLATSGFFNTDDLERSIKRSEIDLIVLRSDVRAPRYWKRQLLLPDAVRVAIKDVYVPAGRVGIYWLYRPEDRRSRPPAGQ